MLEHFRFGGPAAWDLAWQSSAFLALGVAASVALSRRPARAHRALVLAVVAGLLTPALAVAVRAFDWGLLASGRLEAKGEAERGTLAVDFAVTRDGAGGPAVRPEALSVRGVVGGGEVGGRGPVAYGPVRTEGFAFPWAVLAAGAWRGASAVLLARLIVAAAAGWRLVAGARPVEGGDVAEGAEAARRALGVTSGPRVLASDRVVSPVIWCWGRRPVLLVPEGASAVEGRRPVDWAAVMTHELAHWVRRDHWSNLAADVAACLLPWNPLAWWARRRLRDLSELACDDWVIASGRPAAEYAESLLGLVPERQDGLALAAVSRRGGLVGRIGRILDERRRFPRPGVAWTAAAVVATSLAAAAAALAQPHGAAGRDGPPKADAPAAKAEAPNDPPAKDARPPVDVKATVLGLDGKPAAGVAVAWLGMRRERRAVNTLPVAMDEPEGPRYVTLARGTTDAEGRFTSSAVFSSDEYEGSFLIVRAPGAGLTGRLAHVRVPGEPIDISQPLTFRLRPAKTIEGRILTASGEPAAGVRVELESYGNPADVGFEAERLSKWAFQDPEGPFADAWPRGVVTDKDGRFRIEGVVPEGMSASLSLKHADIVDTDLAVSTGGTVPLKPGPIPGPEGLLPATFVYKLGPLRPVEGVVTDKETGRPLAGVTVKLTAFLKGSGRSAKTTTDAAGRYRVVGRSGDSYWATAFPDPGSGYIPVEARREGWPAGAKSLVMDFALPKGRVVRGRVVEGWTGRPVSGASVEYRPTRENPQNRYSYEFRSPVLTDGEGRFAITGLPGPGLVAVEATGPTSGYVRVPVVDPKTGLPTHAYPHGFARVDVPAEGEVPEAKVELRKGVVLEAKAVGPDGRPLGSVNAWCAELKARLLDNWESPLSFPGGRFQLEGAEPGRTYRVFFIDPKRKLGALAELKYDPGGPVEVRLQPTATAKGVVVDSAGRAVRGAQILPNIVLAPLTRELEMGDFYTRGRTTVYAMFTGEPFGQVHPPEFVYDNLIPGVRYYVGVYRGGWTYHPIPPLKPGEVRDLGSLVHKPEGTQ